MRLIGVTGKSGAGKTTFSNMLAQKDNIGVIHVDDILREIKLKYFELLMKEDKNGEKTKVDSKMKMVLYKNKPLFKAFMRVRAKLVEERLKRRIDDLEKQGKRVVLVDDIFLQYQTCYKNLERIFLVERPYVDRRKAVADRDGLTKEEVVAYDMAHYTGNYREIMNQPKVVKINNCGDEQELENSVETVYSKYFASIKEKMRVEGHQLKKSNSRERNSRNTKESERVRNEDDSAQK